MNNDLIVKVGADITGFSRSMSEATKSIKDFSKQNKDTFDAFKQTGGTLTKFITAPAVAATAALTGITLVKGFNRLVGIDTARAKLGALGHDAESVEEIMNNALDSVKGTAYGMDEAATAAASAVAAGIKPGQELTKYLSIAGDAAAVAGTDFNEMGSIFGKVETAQRAYTMELNQLADRGIPIFQWLADEAGVTTGAIREMAADGEISAEMFRGAIEKNIGGAAKEIGDKSFSAAIANIGSDIARIGANFLDAGGDAGGFFSTLKPLLSEFREFLQSTEDKASELGAKFGETFIKVIESIKSAVTWYRELSPAMQKVVGYFTLFASIAAVAIGPLLMLIGMIPKMIMLFTAIKTVVLAVGGAFAAIGWPITLIVAAVIGLAVLIYKYWDEIKAFTIKTWKAAVKGVLVAWDWLKDTWSSTVDWFKSLWTGITGFFTILWTSIVDSAKSTWDGFTSKIKEVWNGIKNIASTTWSAIVDAVMFIVQPFIDNFTNIWNGVRDGITEAFGGLAQFFEGVWELIKNIFLGSILMIINFVTGDFEELRSNTVAIFLNIKDALSNIWEGLKAFFQGSLDAILGYFRAAWDNLESMTTTVFNAVKDFLTRLWDDVTTFFKNTVDSIKRAIKNGWESVKTFTRNTFEGTKTLITNIWNGIRTFFTETLVNIWNDVKQKFEDIKTAVSDKLTEVKESIVEMWNGIILFFRNIDLKQIGKDIIDGLINGIKAKVKAVGDAVKGVADAVTGGIKKILNIKSPSRVLMALGRNTGEGLAIGISDMKGAVERSAEELASAAVVKPDLSYATPNGDYRSLSAALSGEVNVNQRDSMLVGAIASLERKLANLVVEMDGQTVGVIVAPTVSESINAEASGTSRGRGRRRI